MNQPMRLTSLYHEHVALNAQMIQLNGWLLPVSYPGQVSDYSDKRAHAGLQDIGDIGKIDIKGDDLDGFLTDVFGESGAGEVGRATLIEAGDRASLRLTRDQVLELTDAAGRVGMHDRLQQAAASRPCVHVTDLTSVLCALRLTGLCAPQMLEQLCAVNLTPSHFRQGDVVQTAIAGIHGLLLRRDDEDVPGYDLFVERDLGPYLWRTMLEIGVPFKLAPVGRMGEPTQQPQSGRA